MKQEAIDSFLSQQLRNTDLGAKARDMMLFIVNNFNDDVGDVANRYKHRELVSEDGIKEAIREMGYGYVSDLMDTITNFQFNTLLSFIDLMVELKGTRKGMELVLELLGFDSIIQEWWEITPNKPAWTYDIVVIMNTSYVENIYDTLDKIKIFSRNYVIPNIDNIDIRFEVGVFASAAPVMAGFAKQKFTGTIMEKANP